MQEEFDLQEYITSGVEHFVSASLKASLKNPRQSAFLASFALAAKKAAALRKKREAQGLHVPAFLITSITGSCNLHCKGCYSRSTHATNDTEPSGQLTDEEWGDIFAQAKDIGISFVVIAGGEPLLRKGVIQAAANISGILFPVFTNGVFLNDEYRDLFNKHRNLLPVLSLEGGKEATDERRGKGIYELVAQNMEKLRRKGIAFGASVTVTKENIKEVFKDDFINDLSEKGVKFLFYVEYVPVGGVSEELAPDDCDRDFMAENVAKLRRDHEEMVFVSIPGDENASGGCLAAGRGFFHINPHGDAEVCPMSPFSDINVKETSIEEALKSPLFAAVKEKGLLGEDHNGGCALAGREDEVKALLH